MIDDKINYWKLFFKNPIHWWNALDPIDQDQIIHLIGAVVALLILATIKYLLEGV